jgi:hypothetical protein
VTWPGTAIAALLIVAGCAASVAHSSATTRPAEPKTLKLADAVPLEHFHADNTEIDLRQRIAFEGKRELFFGQSDVYDEDDEVVATVPLIIASTKGVRTAVSIADARLNNAEWQFVASGPKSGEAWGVLDDTVTGRGKVVLLAHSTDAGQTWSVSAIDKPFGAGEYDSFSMSADGRGRLTVFVPATKDDAKRAGFYHFRTTDGGRTWSRPEHEPDALDPAEPVDPDGGDGTDESSPPAQTASLRR